jgi:biotin carboxylase
VLGRFDAMCRRYDAVVGFDEFALIPTWQAATVLGLPALDWRVVANMRDKSVQKSVLREAGVPCAESWLIDDIRRQPERSSLERHLPLVLKPYSGAGTVHTYVAHTVPQLAHAVDRLVASPSRTVLCEK